MKKQLLVGIICAALAVTTACGNSDNKNKGGKEKPKSKDGKTIVTLSTYMTSDHYLEAVKQKFEQKYPDIDLQIQFSSSGDEEMDEARMEKNLKLTNTAILSGKGADIIEMSYLPVSQYINKKLLLNMSDALESDQTLDKDDLNTNILNGMKINGGLYTVPTSFYVGTFMSDGDILDKMVEVDEDDWTWEQLEDISWRYMQKEGTKNGRSALANYAPEEFLRLVVKNNSADYIDQDSLKVHFDSPEFIDQMNQVKRMYDEKIITANEAKPSTQVFINYYLYRPLDFFEFGFRFYENPRLLPTPHSSSEAGGTSFLVPSQFGIQANSPVKDEAWKFIAFLMSEEAQSLEERDGFSLLKSVNDKLLDSTKDLVMSDKFKAENTGEIEERHFNQLKQLLASANRLATVDNRLLSIIEEESKSFFSGQKSVEEVAKLIQNRTTTYLNE